MSTNPSDVSARLRDGGYPFHDLPLLREIAADLIDAQSKLLAERARELGDARYMLDAYRNMLGPIGSEVARKWSASGVRRVHFDWGPAAGNMTGEERAQYILDIDKLPKERIRSDEDFNPPIPTEGNDDV